MKALLIPALMLSILIMASANANAAEPHTPKPGSPERKALMDALRLPVQAELKKPVIFKVDRLKVQGDWAFLAGVPLKPDGSEMDYRDTIHQEAIREGAFDGGIFALLQNRNGQWQTVRHIIGATDVPYVDWPQEFGAPEAIFE